MSQEEDVAALSDDDLGSELWDRFGYKAGPITATTRSVYEKKLGNLRKNPPAAPKITPSKRPQNGDHSERAGPAEASPLRRGRKSLPLPSPAKSPARLDIFNPVSPTIRESPATPNPSLELDALPSSRRSSRRVTLAVSPPKSTRVNKRLKPLSSFSSDEDEAGGEEDPNETKVLDLRLENGTSASPQPRTVASAAKGRPKSRLSTPSFPQATGSNRFPARSPRASTAFESPVSLSGFSDSELENEEENDSRVAFGSVLRSRKRPATRAQRNAEEIVNRSPDTESTCPGGLLSSSTYNWVSCSILVVSLTFFLSVFFYYFINSAYFSDFKSPSSHITPAPHVQSSDRYSDLIRKLKAPLCGELLTTSKDGRCLSSRDDIRPALVVIEHIRDLFEDKLLRHFCTPADPASDHFSDDPEVLTLKELRKAIGPKLMQNGALEHLYTHHSKSADETDDNQSRRVTLFHKAVQDAITLIQANPRFGMQAVIGDKGVAALRVSAGNFPVTWPFGCRLRMTLTNAFWTLAIIGCIILISVILYHLFASQKERKNQQQRLFLELLEKSLELLQSPDEPGSMPVLHIRDTLISPSERKDQHLMKLWGQVVKHIESEESRVKVDTEEIEGETFKTWKWLCSPVSLESAAVGSLKTGSIEWQGQAFNEREGIAPSPKQGPSRVSSAETREGSFEAPTSFLKVRNMFDEETVATANSKNDSYWKTKIKNAIIEKCAIRAPDGQHGVCHIFVDERNSKEGLVYVKVRDLESATAAYRALHGWWCEKRLVSVRFLKDERYYSRFPEARNAKADLELDPVVDED